MSAPARMNGNPSTSNDPCKSSPENTGLVEEPTLRAKEHELNGMIATQAAANGAVYVDAFTASIGRDACQPPTPNRWVEPVVPVFPAAPVHPNQFGMRGTAAVVLASIRAHEGD